MEILATELIIVVEIWLPYGSSEIPVRAPDERLQDILRPGTRSPKLDIINETKRLFKSSNLSDLAKKSGQVCIVVGANASSQLATELTKVVVEELTSSGLPDSSITVLGTSDSQKNELNGVPGKEIIHDAQTSLTTTLDGMAAEFPIALNSAFLRADLKIAVAELKPHHFFGLCGLPDVILPGLASADSRHGHLRNRKEKTASDLYEERIDVANSIPNLLALAYAVDADRSPARIMLGTIPECITALKVVTEEISSTSFRKPADIVVMSSGGSPMDETLGRAVEALPAARAACKRDGALIVAAECASGHGGGEFYEWCAEHKESRYLETRLRHSFTFEGFKAAYLQRTLQTHRIYLVSTLADHYTERVFAMRSASTVNSALQTAQRALGSDSTITVIPDASRVVPKLV